MGEEEISDVYLDIALSSLNPSSMHRNFTDAEIDAMLDYSSLSSMLDAVKGTFLMGEEIEDGSVFTTYHLSGDIAGKIIGISITDIPVDVFITVNGAEVCIYGYIHVSKLLLVFNEDTNTEFYFHASADKEGELFIRRQIHTSEFVLSQFKTVHNYDVECRKVKGSDFLSNILMWLFGYMLNATDTITDNFTDSSSSTGKALHGEDIIIHSSSDHYSGSESSWYIPLDLGALAQTSVSMTAGITLNERDCSFDGSTSPVLSSLSAAIKILSIITATLDLEMVNVATGVYRDAWSQNNADSLTKQHIAVSRGSSGSGIIDGYSRSIFCTNYYNLDTGVYSADYQNAWWYSDPDTVVNALSIPPCQSIKNKKSLGI